MDKSFRFYWTLRGTASGKLCYVLCMNCCGLSFNSHESQHHDCSVFILHVPPSPNTILPYVEKSQHLNGGIFLEKYKSYLWIVSLFTFSPELFQPHRFGSMLYVHLLLKAFMTETKPHVENLIQTCLLGFSLLYLKQVLHCSYQASKLYFIGYYLNLFFLICILIWFMFIWCMSSTKSHIVFFLPGKA